MSTTRLPLSTLLGYGVGSLGTGIFSTTPGVLLLFFLTDTLGVPTALAGIAVFLPKFIDVVSDPFVGLMSDRTRSRYGRRRPYLLAGALLMFLTYVFLFNVPASVSPSGAFWYVAVMFTLSSLSYTLFAIPYIAMPAEMSEQPAERVRIVSWRMAFALIGTMVGAALAPMVVGAFEGGRQGYAAMSWLIGGMAAGAMLWTFCATGRVQLSEPRTGDTPLGRQFALTWRNPHFKTLAAPFLLQIVAVATLLAAAPYYSAHIMNADETMVGKMLLAVTLAAVASIPLWSHLARRFGKRAAYTGAMVLLGCATLGLLGGRPDEPVYLFSCLILVGVAFGAQQVLPFAMLIDVIHHDSATHGLRREGFISGIWVAGEKLGLALGPLVAALVLQTSGFMGNLVHAEQSPAAIEGIRAAFATVPAILIAVSLVLLRRYRLD